MDERLLQVKTPAFVIDQEKLLNNLLILKEVQDER